MPRYRWSELSMHNWSWIVESYPGNHMGPTLPFLLGAMQQPIGQPPSSEAAGRETLWLLLVALSTAPENHGVRIQRCDTIHEYVVAQHPFSRGLEWDAIDGVKAPTLEALAESLWARYEDCILAGEFSFTDLAWHAFRPDEIATITSILGGE